MSVKVVAFIIVKPGQDEAFVAAAQPCIAASRAEAGVLRYDLWQEVDGERRFVFDELYADDEAVQAHMASDHFKAFGLAARDLAAARPSITVTHAVEVAGSPLFTSGRTLLKCNSTWTRRLVEQGTRRGGRTTAADYPCSLAD
jgi:quinol monooxygenase YgiN